MTLPSVDAQMLAERVLATDLPRRWTHVVVVAQRASTIGTSLSTRDLLEAAAWVHDIGYARQLAQTGFHPLDGARYLRAVGAPERISGLVAFHSSAASEAEVIGLRHELAEFRDEQTLERDLLWYLDMTTSPDGQVVSFAERMAELRERYSPDHYVIRALDLGTDERVGAFRRAEAWLGSVGLTGQV